MCAVLNNNFRNAIRTLGQAFNSLPRCFFRLQIQLVLDGAASLVAIIAAFIVRFDWQPWRSEPSLHIWVAVIVAARPLVLLFAGTYRSTWRHFHLEDGLSLARRASLVTAGLLAFRLFPGLGLPVLPFSVIVLELCLFIACAGCMRILRRLTHEAVHQVDHPVYRALLVADDSSIAGAVRLAGIDADIELVGVISEDQKMHGMNVAGVPVVGGMASLARSIIELRAELVLVTGGNAQSAEDVLSTSTELGVQVRILPSASDLVRDRVRVSNSLDIEHVVSKLKNPGSDPRPEVVDCFHGRCVLVTGAGGSIGSEISRQIAFLPVSRLIILDQDENSIFELMNELKLTCTEIVPHVGDIRDSRMLEELFAVYTPDIVLHAAAYKHVPVMEANPCEAILNNVMGTRQLADMAERFGCERFVMISTDKACRPASIMGATKRTAEIVVQDRAVQSGFRSRTQFACVRFGNVLGSRGSVVPIFLRQIAAGGPVTITHEEMTRYFMSIPQAVQLVLQAATLASSGDVYMLDMGEPVKIVEFARDLIRMSGLRPDIDIPIQFTGIRPGEKLHEQLWYEDAEVSDSPFPYVFRVKARKLTRSVSPQIAKLEKAAAARASHEEIYSLLRALPIDYARVRSTSAIHPLASPSMEMEAATATGSGGAD
jgi:FlaA1/EpsC-like NDP-sugar epimerase